jgi:uncharacterized protein (TIGR00730 family)
MKVTIFCGSGLGNQPIYKETARQIGKIIGSNGWEVVYGGASIGLMGTVADACLESGGKVHGVIPDFLGNREIAHKNLTKLTVTRNMHERKQHMAEEADVFIALPGGFGTFEEILEIITWKQLGLHQKPVGFLNVNGFYDGLLAFFEHTQKDGFIRRDLSFYYTVWNGTAAFERFAVEYAKQLPPPTPTHFENT